VKRTAKQMLFSYHDNSVIVFTENFYPIADFDNVWRSDKHSIEAAGHTFDIQLGFEAVNLSTKRIALHFDVHQPKVVGFTTDKSFCHKNKAGAGAKNGFARLSEPDQVCNHTGSIEKASYRCAFATWNYQPIDKLELIVAFDGDRIDTTFFKSLQVLSNRTLQCENTDTQFTLIHLDSSLLHAI
jgi:hypothetical protein